jgi:hypothetical protein
MSHSSIPLADQEPKGWRKLCEKAQRERNPQKLDAILKKVNKLLTEHEKRCSEESGEANASSQDNLSYVVNIEQT